MSFQQLLAPFTMQQQYDANQCGLSACALEQQERQYSPWGSTLQHTGGSYTSSTLQVTDVGSLNGTTLNGHTISTNNRRRGREHRLSSDDLLQLGSYTKLRWGSQSLPACLPALLAQDPAGRHLSCVAFMSCAGRQHTEACCASALCCGLQMQKDMGHVMRHACLPAG